MTIRWHRREGSCGLLSPSPSVGWRYLKHSIWCSSLFQGRRRDRQSHRCTSLTRGNTVLHQSPLLCCACWGSSVLRINYRRLEGALHLLQAVTMVCTGSTIVDHLFDLRVWTRIFHGSIFVTAANSVVRLLQILVSISNMTQNTRCLILTCIKPGFLIKSPGDDVDFARTQPLDSCICTTLVSVALIGTETVEKLTMIARRNLSSKPLSFASAEIASRIPSSSSREGLGTP